MAQKLEKYDLMEEIGHGGMATVYRAVDTRLERLVAVKVMHPHLRSAREARLRFTREAKTVARLKHDNILEIYDYSGQDSAECYIATELLTGPTLKEFAEKHGEIPAEIAACFAIEIAEALSAAHAAGVVHRDVKPENVLLHEDRCIKLTDFGIAQMIDAGTMTATGQVLGSPGHMAPEQVEGKECDARSDLFSLGTVLYLLACGRLPFTGKNPHHVLKKLAESDYPDPLRVRPAIGSAMRAILQRLLARDPAERYPSADALIVDLRAFAAKVGITDAAAQLSAYLREPEAVAADLKARILDTYLRLGEEAAARGDVPTAGDHLNRVLAIDDGNTRALALVEGLGRRKRGRAWAVGGLAIAGLAAAIAGTAALVGWPEGPPGVPERTRPDAGPGALNTFISVDASRAVALDARAGLDMTPGDAGAVDAGRGSAGHDARRIPRADPLLPATRTVVFQPRPQGVSIGVDNDPPRPFGPSFRSAELAPGLHTFVFSGECCIEESVRLNLPPGATPFPLARALRFRPASLYVVANVPAEVVVEGTRGRGRSRSVVTVSMPRNPTESVRIEVSAPGHVPYTGAVTLRAGRLTEHAVTLERAAP